MVATSELPETFDTRGIALAHAEYLKTLGFTSLPKIDRGRHIDVFVIDGSDHLVMAGDEWADMCDEATLWRLFPDGFDADDAYGSRAIEAGLILGHLEAV